MADEKELRSLRAQAQAYRISHKGMSEEALRAAIAEAKAEREQDAAKESSPLVSPKGGLDERGMKALWKIEPKATVMIPKDPLNPGLKEVPVTINRATYPVPVGRMVKVPRSVAEVLANSDYLGGSQITVPTFDESQMA